MTTWPPAARVVASSLAVVGSVVLTVTAVRTFGADPYGTLDAGAGVFVGLVPAASVAAAIAAVRAPQRARVLGATALAGALIADQMPAAPPRLVPLLPLALATALMFIAPEPRPEAKLAEPGGCRGWTTAPGWLGLALHSAVGLLYLMSGLVAPGYAVALLWALWALLLVVVVQLQPHRAQWTPAVPLAAAALWFMVMSVGDAVLGWHA
jgi:hypothetical protein